MPGRASTRVSCKIVLADTTIVASHNLSASISYKSGIPGHDPLTVSWLCEGGTRFNQRMQIALTSLAHWIAKNFGSKDGSVDGARFSHPGKVPRPVRRARRARSIYARWHRHHSRERRGDATFRRQCFSPYRLIPLNRGRSSFKIRKNVCP